MNESTTEFVAVAVIFDSESGEEGWGVGYVYPDCPGFQLTTYHYGKGDKAMELAEKTATNINESLGHSREHVLTVHASSMRAQNSGDNVARIAQLELEATGRWEDAQTFPEGEGPSWGELADVDHYAWLDPEDAQELRELRKIEGGE